VTSTEPGPPDLTFRAVAAGDQGFLASLYASTRAAELAQTDWADEAKADFCQMQFELQQTHYITHYPDSVHEVILLGGEPIGRVWVDWRADEARVLDIALLPAWRGRGLGSAVMRRLKEAAQARGVVVTLNVEHNNPAAKRFHVAHGFGLIRDIGTHDFMEWPDPNTPNSES
jgi:ribosomal protein S18 acetylase RimI-like enzyme